MNFKEFFSQHILQEHIRHTKKGWVVYNHDNTKRLSKFYRSKSAAEKRLRQIEYFKHVNEGYRGSYYDETFKDWGFITPNGEVKRMPKHVAAESGEGHHELASRLGYDSAEDAMRHGLVRFAVKRYTGEAVFQLRNLEKSRIAAAKYINTSIYGKTDIEVFDAAIKNPVWYQEFDNPRTAALQIKNLGAAVGLKEAYLNNVEVGQWGYVVPGEGIVEGTEPDDHITLANKYGFKSDKAAIREGCVRFLVDSNGDVNLEMLNRAPQRKMAVHLLKNGVKAPNKKRVFVDFMTPSGNIAGFKDYETIMDAYDIAGIPDGLVDISEAIPTEHQGVPIAAYSREWGFLKTDGRIAKGTGKDGHLELARKLGFQGETDAILRGFVRYVVDPEGVVSLELVPEQKAKMRAALWLKATPNLNGVVYVDMLNHDGNVVSSQTYKNIDQAVAAIKGYKEEGEEKSITETDFEKFRKKLLQDDWFKTWEKPEKPLEPFHEPGEDDDDEDEEDEPTVPADSSGDVPDFANADGAAGIPSHDGANKNLGVRQGPPFLAAD